MKTLCLLSVSILLGFFLKAQEAHFDFDRKVNFTLYKTFTFLGWQEDSDKLINDFDRRRIRDAFRREFSIRKIRQDTLNPDVAISLFLVIDKKTSTTAYGNNMGGAGYYGGGWGWGAGPTVTTFSQEDYLVGALVMDVYDAESKRLIWQGVVADLIDDDPKTRDKDIPKAIAALLKPFPIRGD